MFKVKFELHIILRVMHNQAMLRFAGDIVFSTLLLVWITNCIDSIHMSDTRLPNKKNKPFILVFFFNFSGNILAW